MALSKVKMRERKKSERNVKPKLENVKPKLVEYGEHPVMKYLIPGKDREGMVGIVDALKVKKLAHHVFLGVKRGIRLDAVSELLDCTG